LEIGGRDGVNARSTKCEVARHTENPIPSDIAILGNKACGIDALEAERAEIDVLRPDATDTDPLVGAKVMLVPPAENGPVYSSGRAGL
jgi:hypothetical protein